jgi:hypothetical protein
LPNEPQPEPENASKSEEELEEAGFAGGGPTSAQQLGGHGGHADGSEARTGQHISAEDDRSKTVDSGAATGWTQNAAAAADTVDVLPQVSTSAPQMLRVDGFNSLLSGTQVAFKLTAQEITPETLVGCTGGGASSPLVPLRANAAAMEVLSRVEVWHSDTPDDDDSFVAAQIGQLPSLMSNDASDTHIIFGDLVEPLSLVDPSLSWIHQQPPSMDEGPGPPSAVAEDDGATSVSTTLANTSPVDTAFEPAGAAVPPTTALPASSISPALIPTLMLTKGGETGDVDKPS